MNIDYYYNWGNPNQYYQANYGYNPNPPQNYVANNTNNANMFHNRSYEYLNKDPMGVQMPMQLQSMQNQQNPLTNFAYLPLSLNNQNNMYDPQKTKQQQPAEPNKNYNSAQFFSSFADRKQNSTVTNLAYQKPTVDNSQANYYNANNNHTNNSK